MSGKRGRKRKPDDALVYIDKWDDEKLFRFFRDLFNDPDVRELVSKTMNNDRKVYQGSTFWAGRRLEQWRDHSGSFHDVPGWIDKEVKKAMKNKIKPKVIVLDVASSSSGCTHYVTFVIVMNDVEKPYAYVWDSGVGTFKSQYSDGRSNIYPQLSKWLEFQTIIEGLERSLYEVAPEIAFQKTVTSGYDTFCQTYTLMFRAAIRSSWQWEDVLKYQDTVALDPQGYVVRAFRDIFETKKIQNKVVEWYATSYGPTKRTFLAGMKRLVSLPNVFMIPSLPWKPKEKKKRPRKEKKQR